MNNKQINLLKELEIVLNKVSDECVNDQSFNDLVSLLSIFNKSIDDITSDIDTIVENDLMVIQAHECYDSVSLDKDYLLSEIDGKGKVNDITIAIDKDTYNYIIENKSTHIDNVNVISYE